MEALTAQDLRRTPGPRDRHDGRLSVRSTDARAIRSVLHASEMQKLALQSLIDARCAGMCCQLPAIA